MQSTVSTDGTLAIPPTLDSAACRMTGHVFISYSSRQRELTERLADALQAADYRTWWDKALASEPFEPQIREAIEAASAVLVIWSDAALTSNWVYAEALRADRLGRLVHCAPSGIDPNELPSPYNGTHVHPIDLSDLEPLLESLARATRGEATQERTPLHVRYEAETNVPLFSTKIDPPDPARILSPADLLRASTAAVEYVDAAGARADMLDWCRRSGAYETDRQISRGRLVHGPGGLGKTRLMAEVARTLREEDGWFAHFLQPKPTGHDDPRLRRAALRQLLSTGQEAGLLLVIDYAEARQDEVKELALAARNRQLWGDRPFRLVLLARGEHWWPPLWADREAGDAIKALFGTLRRDGGDVLTLEPLRDRLAVFDRMVEALRPPVAELRAARAYPPERLPDAARRQRIADDPAFARPLALQMEALIALMGGSGGDGGLDKLLEDVVMLERGHWGRVIDGLAPGTGHEEALCRAVSQVTSVGALANRDEAIELFQADRTDARRPAADTWRDLRSVYAAGVEGLAPLEPDIVGEHEVLHTADKALVDGCLAWIETLPENPGDREQCERTRRRRALLTVLQRATAEHHGARRDRAVRMLDHIIGRHL